MGNSSTTNHTGILTASNPGITFNSIDHFVSPAQKAEIVTQLNAEISRVALTPIQRIQYNIQRSDIDQGKIAQLEMLFGPGMFS